MRKSGIPFTLNKNHKRTPNLHILPLCIGLLAQIAPNVSPADSSTPEIKANLSNFNIPAQPLYAALSALAEQSGLQFVYNAEMVKGINSPGVNGQFSVADALKRILAGTGISYEFSSGNTVTLEKMPNVGLQIDPTLPVVSVVGQTPSREAFNQLEDNTSYHISNASSALKTDTPILETPQSIQVVPRALMDDQQAFSIEDALKNVTGISQNLNNTYSNPYLRGFIGDSSYFRNGLRQGAQPLIETAQLSSIEVVKGPMSGLYGRIQAGGLIDMITNRPQEEAHYSVQQQVGSFDTYRTVVDATGSLVDDKTLLYRLNFVYKANNSFRDYVSGDHVFVMPSVTWKPSDKFDINANMEYSHDNYVADQGIIYANAKGVPLNTPISRFFGDAVASQANPIRLDKIVAAYDWNYHFNSDWKLTNRFAYNKVDYHQSYVYQTALSANAQTFREQAAMYLTENTTFTTNLDLTGNFDTGFAHHNALLGYDYYNYVAPNGPGSSVSPIPLSLLPVNNVANPYQNIPLNTSAFAVNTSSLSFTKWNGLYLQDQIKLLDELQIMIGGRADWSTTGSASGSGAPINSILIPTSLQTRIDAFRPRFGILYQPVKWGSIYGNYIQSIGPTNGTSANGIAFAPQQGEQYEVGAKGEFFDNRLLMTLAAFSITKTNLLTSDPANPLYSIAVGKALSKGIEFTAQGDITDNISVYGGYTYDVARVTEDTTYNGKILPNVPLNSGNMWAKYKFDDDVASGLSIGTGVYLVGSRQANNANTWQMPGYGRWDANLAYAFKPFNDHGGKVTAQLNVYNILDKTYYTNTLGGAAASYLYTQPGAPLSFMGSVRVDF